MRNSSGALCNCSRILRSRGAAASPPGPSPSLASEPSGRRGGVTAWPPRRRPACSTDARRVPFSPLRVSQASLQAGEGASQLGHLADGPRAAPTRAVCRSPLSESRKRAFRPERGRHSLATSPTARVQHRRAPCAVLPSPSLASEPSGRRGGVTAWPPRRRPACSTDARRVPFSPLRVSQASLQAGEGASQLGHLADGPRAAPTRAVCRSPLSESRKRAFRPERGRHSLATSPTARVQHRRAPCAVLPSPSLASEPSGRRGGVTAWPPRRRPACSTDARRVPFSPLRVSQASLQAGEGASQLGHLADGPRAAPTRAVCRSPLSESRKRAFRPERGRHSLATSPTARVQHRRAPCAVLPSPSLASEPSGRRGGVTAWPPRRRPACSTDARRVPFSPPPATERGRG